LDPVLDKARTFKRGNFCSISTLTKMRSSFS
jgi:hypothetical protein